MIYAIDAEILSNSLEYGLRIKILSGNNLNLFTSIPKKNDKTMVFEKKEELHICYFFGKFQYKFNVEFQEYLEEEQQYKFLINEVAIEQNFRKHKREIVELNALILDSKSMYYATILDLSEKGMKIETDRPIYKKKIEVIFANDDGTSTKRKGKVVWNKEGEECFYYGVHLK